MIYIIKSYLKIDCRTNDKTFRRNWEREKLYNCPGRSLSATVEEKEQSFVEDQRLSIRKTAQ